MCVYILESEWIHLQKKRSRKREKSFALNIQKEVEKRQTKVRLRESEWKNRENQRGETDAKSTVKSWKQKQRDRERD